VPVGARLLAAAALASCVTALVELAGVRLMGTKGLFVPLAVVVVVILLRSPVAAISLVVALAVVCEGPTFGIFGFTGKLYKEFYKGLTPLDVVVALGILSVVLDLMRRHAAPRLPRSLALPLAVLALAMIAGIVTGRAGGASMRDVVLSEHVLGYLLLLPLAVVNLDLDRRAIAVLLQGALGLALIKAALGVAVVVSAQGDSLDASSTLSYYEPTANWLILIAILGVVAAVVGRLQPPRWLVVGGAPLLIASLALSYRRSFWIAAGLGLLLVVLLGSSPLGRRMLLPVGLLVAAAIWLLGSVPFQSQSPIVRRAESLSPTQIQSTAEDRYRLDERANVVAELRKHPVQGLGLTIPWTASARALPVEHPGGRDYVHFAALWFWLKLGILGLIAYASILLSALLLAWRTWRRNETPLLRCFGLASLSAVAGLAVIETTASFTGIDARFTVLFAAQLGLLTTLARPPGLPRSA
jgi:hypothetical protein